MLQAPGGISVSLNSSDRTDRGDCVIRSSGASNTSGACRTDRGGCANRASKELVAGVVAVGNALIDQYYFLSNPVAPGIGALVKSQSRQTGGVEANVASAIAALDVPAGIVAPLGDDHDAERIILDLQARGVDTTGARRIPGDETGCCVILVMPGVDRIILGGGTGIRTMRLTEEDRAFISKWQVIFASAYVPLPVLRDLAQLRDAASPRQLFAFDLPDTFDDLSDRGFTRKDFDDLLPSIDLLLTNRPGALSYTMTDDFDEACRIIESRLAPQAKAAITDGANGARLFWPQGGSCHVPAFKVEAVDPTGAGDAFHAALIAAWLLEGKDPESAGRIASAAGALACLNEGARQLLPKRSDITNFLMTHLGTGLDRPL